MVVVIVVFLLIHIAWSFNTHSQETTVTSVDRVMSVDYSKWLVLGTDESGNAVVLENTDNWLRWKFNCSDLQATIQPGKTYRCEVIGYRVHFLSWYENILEVSEVRN